MSQPILHQIRVVRYAPDGGYAAREWLRAFGSVEFPPTIADGEAFRLGVQITKKRAVDVIVRVEHLDSITQKMRSRLGRSVSDSLFRHPKLCRANVAQTKRPLAVLGARHMGKPIRILVCAPK